MTLRQAVKVVYAQQSYLSSFAASRDRVIVVCIRVISSCKTQKRGSGHDKCEPIASDSAK